MLWIQGLSRIALCKEETEMGNTMSLRENVVELLKLNKALLGLSNACIERFICL